MSFGLSEGPSTCQKATHKILKHLVGKKVFVHLDDISVMAAIFEKHLMLMRNVYILLRNSDLTVKLEKNKFLRCEIKYLGVC